MEFREIHAERFSPLARVDSWNGRLQRDGDPLKLELSLHVYLVVAAILREDRLLREIPQGVY